MLNVSTGCSIRPGAISFHFCSRNRETNSCIDKVAHISAICISIEALSNNFQYKYSFDML